MGADTECDLAFEATFGGAPGIYRPASPPTDRAFLRRRRTARSKATKPICSASSTAWRTQAARNRCSRSIRPRQPAAWRPSCSPSPIPENPFTSTAPPIACGRQEPFWRYPAWPPRSRPRAGLAIHVVARFHRHRLRLLGHFATGAVAIRAAVGDCRLRRRRAVVFPVLVLIAATAAALGPWMGFFSAGIGVLLSAAHAVCDRPRARPRPAAAAARALGRPGFRAASSARASSPSR